MSMADHYLWRCGCGNWGSHNSNGFNSLKGMIMTTESEYPREMENLPPVSEEIVNLEGQESRNALCERG